MVGHNPSKEELQRLLHAFGQAKAENDEMLVEQHAHAFVQTKAYRDALDGVRSILIGRKGSGKTALILGFKQQQSDRYLAQASIDIRADDFPLEALFSFFYADSVRLADGMARRAPHISDLPAFIDPVRLAAFAWNQSLRCAAVYVTAGKLLSGKNHLSSQNRKRLLRARRALNRYMGPKLSDSGESGSEVVFSLLIYFFQSAQGLIDKALGIHTHEISVLLAAITRGLTNKLTGTLDKKVEDAARIVATELEGQGKKCLLTLDKFDDYYDEFYRQKHKHEGSLQRREFLAALLHGLVLAARDLKLDPRFRWLHILFTVPMDKFIELHIRERAELEQTHVARLEWTPPELFEYVNRRIAYALDMPPEEVSRAWSRLFPFEVTNATVRDVKENSFLYIARHTLWRPRELQMYVHAILQRMDETREPADEEMFRRVVRAESQQVIKREFIEEYMSEYPGLPGLTKKLEALPLRSVMSYTDLCDAVAGIRLFDEPMNPAEVVLRLYLMGIVGIRQVFARERRYELDPSITQNREEVAYRFCYNSTDIDPFPTTSAVVFHPLFFHYLDIKHEEKYVVNQLSWDMFER